MLLHKTPLLFRWFYPSLMWKVKTDEKEIYLTFDDGPIPEVTPWVLRQLELYNAKGTFFCLGENVMINPTIFRAIKNAGHSIGNHTYNHLNGWKTSVTDYLNNYELAQCTLDHHSNEKILFRPPYGKIKLRQIKQLKNCKIVMWDVLSGDYDQYLSPGRILKKSINATEKGSVIVFHDNMIAFENLKQVLPKYLEHFSKAGFKFRAL